MNNEKRLIDANGLLRIFNSIKYINPSTISIIQNAEIERCASFVQTAPTEKGEEWIPITYRHMDEKELWDVCRFYGVEHPTDLNEDEKLAFDCSMPDDGQRVLISTRWGVFADTSEVTVEDGNWEISRAERRCRMNNEVCVGYLTNIRDMFVVGSERCEGEALEYQNNFISALNYAIGLISDTESPEGEWTPVSKHLPDKYDSYLVMWRPLTEGYPD